MMKTPRKKTKSKDQKKKFKCGCREIFLLFLAKFFGCFVIYSFYTLLTIEFKVPHKLAIYFSLGLAGVLFLLITFIRTFRCIFFLLLPQVFSNRGRTAIMAYVFIITLTGPAINIVKNVEVLTDSLACGQDQLKHAAHGLIEAAKAPLIALKEVLKKIMVVIEKTVEKIEVLLKEITRTVNSLINTIQKAFSWLGSIQNTCNDKSGTPYERCAKSFEGVVQVCREKLGKGNVVCNLPYLLKNFCSALKAQGYFCDFIGFIDFRLFDDIKKKLRAFQKQIQEVFNISITFDETYEYSKNTSKTLSEVREDVNKDFSRRSKNLVKFFKYFSFSCSFFFLWVLFKTFHYKHKFMTQDRYQNCYITGKFHELDDRRKKMQKDCALPLTNKERGKYIEITSLKMVKSERNQIFKSGLFLIVSSTQIIGILITDFSLFWLLSIMQYHGSQEGGLESDTKILKVNVTGSGIVSDLCKELVDIFEPMVTVFNVDPSPCLPRPHKPNFAKFDKIGFLMISCWFFLILEPYGLRFRQVIMEIHYPQRTIERTVWLYSQIMRKRSNFIKYARRQMRRKILKDSTRTNEYEMNCWQLFLAKINDCWLLRKIFGSNKENSCMLCGSSFGKGVDIARCLRPGCSGVYCSDCYVELDDTCSLCMEPMEYGDYSDISEEVDSSDDQMPTDKKNAQKKGLFSV